MAARGGGSTRRALGAGLAQVDAFAHRARALGGRCVLGGLVAAACAAGAAANLLADPAGASNEPAPSWRVVGLPKQGLPLTQYHVVSDGERRVLEIEANASYGNLVHEWAEPVVAHQLSWRWRVDVDNPATDLRRKAGDDHVVAVCVMLELPLAAIAFWERQMLRLARALSGERLPAATMCYAWDLRQPTGAALPSPYTRRVRWLVLRGAGEPVGAWRSESRDLQADFVQLFGDESTELPPLRAVLVAADADNTRGRSVARVGDLLLR